MRAVHGGAKASYAVLQIAAFVGVPLTKVGRLVAGLAVHSAQPREFAPDEIEAIEDTAEATWASVGRARSEAALRDADRRKDEFIATLAHELRNPLAPVSNAVHLLTKTHGELPKVRRAAEVVNRQLRQITLMIDDLMDLSRVSRGLVELRLETLDLAEVVQEAVETSEPGDGSAPACAASPGSSSGACRDSSSVRSSPGCNAPEGFARPGFSGDGELPSGAIGTGTGIGFEASFMMISPGLTQPPSLPSVRPCAF